MWRVRGVLRDYDWGEVDGLARWSCPTGGPQAELWFGIHPSAPALILDDEGRETGETLDTVMSPQRFPLLVKLLAAARPLSIQVHPERELAARMHAQGRLPDANEKTEILMALEPFSVQAGWRELPEALAVLAAAGIDPAHLESARTHADAVRMLLDLDEPTVVNAVRGLPEAALLCGLDPASVDSLKQIAQDFPDDAGVLVCALLRHKVLEPGSSIGVRAGVIHSYVRGLGVEVMTSSDNVIRLGLTSKPVDVAAALAAVTDASPTDGSDFDFSLRVETDSTCELASGYRVVIPLDGTVTVSAPGSNARADVGTAVVIGDDEPSVHLHVIGRAVVAEAG